MELVTWNVNSIRARHERLVGWLRQHQPDVVCLQETKVVDDTFPTASFAELGYQVATLGQRTYNGVAIAARSELIDVVRGLDDGDPDDQARAISATVGGVRVVCVYVPNGQAVGTDKYRYKLAWLARLRRFLDRSDPAQPLVLCGDMNVAPDDRDVHDPARWAGDVLCSDAERAALAEVLGWGLVDLYRDLHPEPGRYSWWDYRGVSFFRDWGLRIDHVFGTEAVRARLVACDIDREARKGKDASDHAPVVLELRDPA